MNIYLFNRKTKLGYPTVSIIINYLMTLYIVNLHRKWGILMKNDECTIYLITKNGSKQRFRKDKNGWKQTSSKGIVRRCTAEQVLSHILPSLAFGHVIIKVEPDIKRDK